MATLTLIDRGTNYLQYLISGLQYPARQYDAFQIDWFAKVDGRYIYYGSKTKLGSQVQETGNATTLFVSDLYFDKTYGAAAYASYGGQWFLINTNYVDGTTLQPNPPNFAIPGFTTNFIDTTFHYYMVEGYQNNGEMGIQIRYRPTWSSTYSDPFYASNNGISYRGSRGGFAWATGYYFSARFFTVDNKFSYWSNDIYLVTSPDTPSAPVTITSRVEGGFNLSWGSATGASSYELDYRLTGSSNWTTISGISGTTYQLTGLAFGTTYEFRARGVANGENSYYTSITSGTTAPQTPTISPGAITNSSITVNTGSMSGNYDDILVERYDANSQYIDTKTAQANSSVQWTGLPTGTTYRFKARSRREVNNTTLYSVNYSATLDIRTGARPSNFAWTTTKVSGGNFNLTAAEWNALTARINEFRVYKGLGNYSFTSASSGANYTAAIFNQAVNAISVMSPPTVPPSTRSSGDDVYAAYLNTLRDSLNSIV